MAAIESFERALEINPHLDHVYVEILRLRARMDEDVRLQPPTAGRRWPLHIAAEDGAATGRGDTVR